VGDNEEKRKALEGEMQVLQKARIEKSRQLDRARDAARDVTRQMDGARREAREALLREADIICGTLAGVGQESLQQYEFDTVIIDEAAQSVEVSALIPLKYRCTRCILVGGELVP
jgi:senataxin